MAAMTRRSTFQSLCKKLSLVRICEIGTHRYNIKPSVQTYVLISIQGKTIISVSNYGTGTRSYVCNIYTVRKPTVQNIVPSFVEHL